MRFLLPAFAAALIWCAPASAATVHASGGGGSVARAAASKRTVSRELTVMRNAGQITPEQYGAYTGAYNAAKSTVKSLKGTRRKQLTAVIANLDSIAAKRALSAPSLPALFLTLERNRAWWSGGKGIGAGARVAFPGSELVWQYYPGQGLQIQWLATFGKANGYLKAKNVQNTKLKLLLDEAVSLATWRANGIAWEYLFKFGGGSPPWVSGMAQATGIQALSRAAIKYTQSDPARYESYLTAARNALGIFNVAPPEGVRVNTVSGAHYLIYSYSRALRVQNAFTQTISALHDFVELTGDPNALQIFLAGERQLRAETPTYDTGAWSMYSNQSEANLNYHKESINFLSTLCQSLTDDIAAGAATGGVAPGGIPAIDPAIYCLTAQNYKNYLVTPPVITLANSSLRKGKQSRVKFALSKIARVSLTVRRDGAVIHAQTVQLSHGNRYISFKPSKTGAVEITLLATDLAGNKASATGTATVR